jgi:hypothetical protein
MQSFGLCIEILYRINIFDLRETSVACAVGPGVNTLLVFSHKPNFCNLFEFPATKSTQKSISSTP